MSSAGSEGKYMASWEPQLPERARLKRKNVYQVEFSLISVSYISCVGVQSSRCLLGPLLAERSSPPFAISARSRSNRDF